jgi:hypothetical protein
MKSPRSKTPFLGIEQQPHNLEVLIMAKGRILEDSAGLREEFGRSCSELHFRMICWVTLIPDSRL